MQCVNTFEYFFWSGMNREKLKQVLTAMNIVGIEDSELRRG